MKNLITVNCDRTVDLNPFASLQFSNVTTYVIFTYLIHNFGLKLRLKL